MDVYACVHILKPLLHQFHTSISNVSSAPKGYPGRLFPLKLGDQSLWCQSPLLPRIGLFLSPFPACFLSLRPPLLVIQSLPLSLWLPRLPLLFTSSLSMTCPTSFGRRCAIPRDIALHRVECSAHYKQKCKCSMVRQETVRHQCAYRAVENIRRLTKHAIIAAQMHCHHATLRHGSA